MKKVLVSNIGMLATPKGSAAKCGKAQGEIEILRDAWVLIENGVIAKVGTGKCECAEGAEVIDAGGKLVTPGLVDAHTHLIFGGWRQNELGSSSTARPIWRSRMPAAASSPPPTPPAAPRKRSCATRQPWHLMR